MFTSVFLLNIVYFSVCLTSSKLYWIEDQLADVSTRFYTSASWSRVLCQNWEEIFEFQCAVMKVLLHNLHLGVHAQELLPKKLQPHNIKSMLDSGSERVKYHLYHYPKLNDSFEDYFLTDSIYFSKYNSSYCILW